MNLVQLRKTARDALNHGSKDWQESYGTPDPYRGIEEWVMYADDANFISACSPSLILDVLDYTQKLEATVQRVRDIHQPFETRDAWRPLLVCEECTDPIEDNLVEYPCPTIEALGDTK